MKNWSGVTTGDMRDSVRIQHRITVKDSYGSDVETWSAGNLVKALVEQGVFRPNEQYYSGLSVTLAQNPTRVTVRFRTDCSTTDRLIWGDHVFNVVGVRDPEGGRRRFTELYCVESQT